MYSILYILFLFLTQPYNYYCTHVSFVQTDPSADLKVRMKEAMSHAGVSITVTSLTDFVAFIISTSTSLPALASFCFYAATGILFLFLFQCIIFGAYVVIDARRQKARRMDCCCCFTVAENEAHDKARAEFEANPGRVSKFMKNSFGPWVVNKNVGILVTIASMGLLGAGVYGGEKQRYYIIIITSLHNSDPSSQPRNSRSRATSLTSFPTAVTSSRPSK